MDPRSLSQLATRCVNDIIGSLIMNTPSIMTVLIERLETDQIINN